MASSRGSPLPIFEGISPPSKRIRIRLMGVVVWANDGNAARKRNAARRHCFFMPLKSTLFGRHNQPRPHLNDGGGHNLLNSRILFCRFKLVEPLGGSPTPAVRFHPSLLKSRCAQQLRRGLCWRESCSSSPPPFTPNGTGSRLFLKGIRLSQPNSSTLFTAGPWASTGPPSTRSTVGSPGTSRNSGGRTISLHSRWSPIPKDGASETTALSFTPPTQATTGSSSRAGSAEVSTPSFFSTPSTGGRRGTTRPSSIRATED